MIGRGTASMLRRRHVPRIERFRMNKSLLIVGALASASLTACYVVPIDPRTG